MGDDTTTESRKDSKNRDQKNHKKYRRDKPWDTDDIDHWKIDDGWDPEKDKLAGGRLLEESSFATLFPKYRESYLRQVWPVVTRALDKVKIACELNLVEGSMTVRTTSKTADPYIILKARDLLKLLARSIPVAQALKILEDDYHCDIVKIGGMVRNKERFVKRRQRLLGPDGSTLKALEILTSCYILVQGNTVSILGNSFKGMKQARRVVVDCMNNIHPVYNIKTLMIQKELAKDPALKDEDWSRFLPHFKKKNVQRKKPKEGQANKKKKEYTPFPPAQTPRKVDIQLETGEYFASEQERKERRLSERQAVAKKNSQAKRLARLQQDETAPSPKKQKVSNSDKSDQVVELDRLKDKLKKHSSKTAASINVSDFVAGK